jgi:uncharacterized beta-barrel protein YwiB (DUF1934 family)
MFDFKVKGNKIEIIRGGEVDRVIEFKTGNDLREKLSTLHYKLNITYNSMLKRGKNIGNEINTLKGIIRKTNTPNARKPSKPSK